MFETFSTALSAMLVLFVCIVIGYILNKKRICASNTAGVLSKLETHVFVPALTINSFMNNCTVKSLSENYTVFIYSAILLAVAMIIAIPLSKFFVKEGYVRNIYKYALTFGNIGFVGNAVVFAMMGDAGLYKYMMFTTLLNVVIYAWGYPMLTQVEHGEYKSVRGSILKRFINPTFISLTIGVVLGMSGLATKLPQFVSTTVSNLGACMGPVAMVLTGFVVADYDFVGLIKRKEIYIASLLRLIVLPLIFLGILKVLGAGKEIMYFCLFAFGAPLGLNTVVFPASVGGDTSTGASMAMISHTLCIITIPILYSFIAVVL